MKTPSLDELPDPPAGQTGWPWTEASDRLPETMEDGSAWPRISIVTPSYNQGALIEETIRSVLLQRYPRLEYIVIDGGSDDETVEILEKYDQWIDYWVSESDEGQSTAINKGFDWASGRYGSWINSDDWLCQGALVNHAQQVGFSKNRLYAGICLVHEGETLTRQHSTNIRTLEDLVRLPEYWRASDEQAHIVQPETLFPIEAFRAVGGLNSENHYTMDFELWGKMMVHGLTVEATDVEYGAFRKHEDQKTSDQGRTTNSLVEKSHEIISLCPSWSAEKKERLHSVVDSYERCLWKRSGRLARTSLPRGIVKTIREIKKHLVE
jgi:glycosyltransferase involved in cell wall biosynthesis